MRVLLQIRDNYRERPGGDAIQAERTAAALRNLGVDAELSADPAPDLTPYALVHIFNTTIIDAPFRQTLHARNWGRPIALSTIYWDLGQYRAATWPVARRPAEARHVAALLARERAWQAFVLRAARVLLPNAHAEADALRRAFPAELATARVQIVPNGAEARFARGDGARFCARHGLGHRGFVLCAARKEDRKNQHRLIDACAALGRPLVLIGAEPPEYAGYVADCRDRAAARGADVRFLPHGGPDELADAYAAARVHALPSLFESVGLASLEAALGGANIVSTRESAAREYLGEAAWYCDPYDTASIRNAVAAAYAAPLQTTLGPHVAEHFSWQRVAEATAQAYREILAGTAGRTGMHDTCADDAPTARPAWLPELPPAEYAAYLEDLIQRQLAVTDGLEAELAALAGRQSAADAARHVADERAQQLAAGLAAEATERRRVEAAYRGVASDAEALQRYCRELEAALAARGGRLSRFSRIWGRRPAP